MRLRGGGMRGQKDGLPHGGGIWLRHGDDAGRLRRARRRCHARGALAQHGEPRAARLQAADCGARAHAHESVRAGGRRRLLQRPQGRRNRQAIARLPRLRAPRLPAHGAGSLSREGVMKRWRMN